MTPNFINTVFKHSKFSCTILKIEAVMKKILELNILDFTFEDLI